MSHSETPSRWSGSNSGEVSFPPRPILRLFVSGLTPRSTEAITNLREICDRYLQGRCELEVVDILKRPEAARRERIVALPTLVRHGPGLPRRLVGDLANKDRVLQCLDLATEEK